MRGSRDWPARGITVRFAELCFGLGWGDEEMVLALWAYFDESGHTEDPNVSVLAIGGCVSSARQWQCLVPDWEDTLRDYAVAHFHTKDFAHRRGEFENWPEEKRQELLGRLVGLMNRDIGAYVGAAIPLPDTWRKHPDDMKARLQDPYHGCLIFCVETMIAHIASAAEQKINIVLAHHPEHSVLATAIIQGMREEHGGILGSLTFDSPAGFIQLQTADLVAYELQHFVTGTKYKGRDKSKPRWAMRQFLTKPHYFRQMRFRGDEQPSP